MTEDDLIRIKSVLMSLNFSKENMKLIEEINSILEECAQSRGRDTLRFAVVPSFTVFLSRHDI